MYYITDYTTLHYTTVHYTGILMEVSDMESECHRSLNRPDTTTDTTLHYFSEPKHYTTLHHYTT